MLLSVGVPRVSNCRITRHVETVSPGILVFFLASHARGGSQLGNFSLGTGSCLTGPFCPRRLLTEVRRQFSVGRDRAVRRRICRFNRAAFYCGGGRLHAHSSHILVADQRTSVLHLLTGGVNGIMDGRVVRRTI